MEKLSAELSVGNQSSILATFSVSLMSREVVCAVTLSLPGQQIAILSAENIITTISYSRTEECEVKEIRRFTSSATLEI